MTYSKNEIIERDEANNVYPYQMQKGYRVNQNKGLIALGLFKDYDDIRNSPTQKYGPVMPGDIKYKDVNGDGVVDDNDIVAVGATNRPNLIYGLGLLLNGKDLMSICIFKARASRSFSCPGNVSELSAKGNGVILLKELWTIAG